MRLHVAVREILHHPDLDYEGTRLHRCCPFEFTALSKSLLALRSDRYNHRCGATAPSPRRRARSYQAGIQGERIGLKDLSDELAFFAKIILLYSAARAVALLGERSFEDYGHQGAAFVMWHAGLCGTGCKFWRGLYESAPARQHYARTMR